MIGDNSRMGKGVYVKTCKYCKAVNWGEEILCYHCDRLLP